MTLLIAGLLLFLGVHSVRIVAEDFRTAQIARLARTAGRACIRWPRSPASH